LILVVGATGQLGTTVVSQLVAEGNEPVRAFVRRDSEYHHLLGPDVDLAFGDLRDEESIARACSGVRAVIATASVVFPRGRYDFARDEGLGYGNLISGASRAGVERLAFVSNEAPAYRRIPTIQYKRLIEARLRESEVPYTIVRSAPFMDDYFALIGSEIPLRGVEAPTLRRPFWLSRSFLSATAGLIEQCGVAMVNGTVERCHSFIAIEDVARFLIRSCSSPDLRNRQISIGGPEALSWRRVAETYERVLGKRVRVLSSPAEFCALSALALRPLSVAAANQMALLWLVASHDIVVDSSQLAEELDITPTSAEEFLAERAALPAAP
jgi:uncharacterized protein YbjT (DUF2867 family)